MSRWKGDKLISLGIFIFHVWVPRICKRQRRTVWHIKCYLKLPIVIQVVNKINQIHGSHGDQRRTNFEHKEASFDRQNFIKLSPSLACTNSANKTKQKTINNLHWIYFSLLSILLDVLALKAVQLSKWKIESEKLPETQAMKHFHGSRENEVKAKIPIKRCYHNTILLENFTLPSTLW